VGEAVVGPGIAGLAANHGVRDALSRFDLLLPELRRADGRSRPKPGAVSVGVAGAIGAPEAAAGLAQALAEQCEASACVASDVVTAHLGALGGAPGTMLIAGTGAVAFGVSGAGGIEIVDGLGPELGDSGSGYWIGRAGLRAGAQGVRNTELVDAARQRFGEFSPPSWLAAQPHPIASVASFAPVVLDAAERGDRVSLEIAEEAARHLVSSARRASDGLAIVSVLGGLSAHPWFLTTLTNALESEGLVPQRPLGTALRGAALAASRTDLPHERLIHRAI